MSQAESKLYDIMMFFTPWSCVPVSPQSKVDWNSKLFVSTECVYLPCARLVMDWRRARGVSASWDRILILVSVGKNYEYDIKISSLFNWSSPVHCCGDVWVDSFPLSLFLMTLPAATALTDSSPAFNLNINSLILPLTLLHRGAARWWCCTLLLHCASYSSIHAAKTQRLHRSLFLLSPTCVKILHLLLVASLLTHSISIRRSFFS